MYRGLLSAECSAHLCSGMLSLAHNLAQSVAYRSQDDCHGIDVHRNDQNCSGQMGRNRLERALTAKDVNEMCA